MMTSAPVTCLSRSLVFTLLFVLSCAWVGCVGYGRDPVRSGSRGDDLDEGSSNSADDDDDDDDDGWPSSDDDDDDGPVGDDDDDDGAPAGVDSDGDGLSDAEEQQLGTDPWDPDSDGDGHQDEDEVGAGTDPLDSDDHPYSLGWPIDPCRDDIVPTGNDVGQVTGQFELLSQTGETVRLHDFCGQAVFMVSAAFW
ncbi:MAG: hypothetical protein CMP23_02735 [Rickettsiales bacterium]|nr:hypothetical protein [Rickettsiales bacterium]